MSTITAAPHYNSHHAIVPSYRAGKSSQSHHHASQSSVTSHAGRKDKILAERFKTQMCRSYEKKGSCPYENKCMFAHGDADLRTPEMNVRDGLFTEESIEAFRRAQRLLKKRANNVARQHSGAAAMEKKERGGSDSGQPDEFVAPVDPASDAFSSSAFCTTLNVADQSLSTSPAMPPRAGASTSSAASSSSVGERLDTEVFDESGSDGALADCREGEGRAASRSPMCPNNPNIVVMQRSPDGSLVASRTGSSTTSPRAGSHYRHNPYGASSLMFIR